MITATLNNIVTLFLAVAEAHSQVRSVGTGERSDQSPAGNADYPQAWLESPYMLSHITQGHLIWSLAFVVLDLPGLDDADKFTITNKTCLIAISILERFKAELESRIDTATLEDGWDGISWEDNGDDSNAGWRIDIKVKARIPVDQCNGPFAIIP
jgi:hypothetical protein